MKRGSIAVVVALVLIAIAVASGSVKGCAHRRSNRPVLFAVGSGRPPDDEALARLKEMPLYRSLLRAKALRWGTVDGDGTLHLEVDPRAFVEPRLSAMGYAGTSDLVPMSARGTSTNRREAMRGCGTVSARDRISTLP